MSDVIERARSGRARCRGCNEKIAKDELRFGEQVPNPFADEEDAQTIHWFHLACGADKRPAKFAAALAECAVEIPDREELARIASLGTQNDNLAKVLRAERSPSGRARCRQCRELIAKDVLRVAIEVDAEATAMSTSYFVHAGCAVAKIGGEGLLDKLERVSTNLEATDLEELRGLFVDS